MKGDCSPDTAKGFRTIQLEEPIMKELSELGHEMSNSIGMLSAHLENGLRKTSDKHIQLIEEALNLSLRGMESLKKLMRLVGTLEESLCATGPRTGVGGFIAAGKTTKKQEQILGAEKGISRSVAHTEQNVRPCLSLRR
jgi:hypothetical protein